MPQLSKNTVSEVIKTMTLEEKAHLVVGNGFYLPEMAQSRPQIAANLRPEQKKVVGVSGTTYAIPRADISSLVMTDGPSGVNVYYQPMVRTYFATAWPVPTLQASSWDSDLIRRVGAAYGREAKEYGIDLSLAPGMNIHRNPLGGRNFEYYSEDPLITGSMATAMVKGIQSQNVGTAPKHFAANNQETNRNTVNTIVSERALREIYLRGFEMAVKEAQPWSVMSSYNLINGVHTAESNDLLTTILRKEWGFKGFVMTDWYGGKDPVAMQKAGNNLLMPGTGDQAALLVKAVKEGTLPESVLDKNVRGVLQAIARSNSAKKYVNSDRPDLEKSAQLAREVAAESIILLKNNQATLPIPKTNHIVSLFGTTSYDLIVGGSGSGATNIAYKISLPEGLMRAGYTLEPALQQAYTAYVGGELIKRPKKSFIQQFRFPYKPIEEFAVDPALLQQSAAASDLAILTLGRVAGEGADRTVEDLTLTAGEQQLLRQVSEAFHSKNKKVVVILNIGGVIEVNSWREQADAIVLAWQPGMEGGNALADILSGKVNPSGKLATTFFAAYQDDPTAKNFPGKTFPERAEKNSEGGISPEGIPAEVTYEEGIYIGYRYYNTFNVKPAYEFGHGLSYTQFSYSPLKLSAATFAGQLTVSLTVTNTGKVAGKDVVQLYLSAPAGQLDKPTSELKGFAKTRLLAPGQSQTITFTLSLRDLASFDTNASAWVAEAGSYTVRVGASSVAIKQTDGFRLAQTTLVEKVHKALTAKVPINELKPASSETK